ncbi:MAG: hypothetical protein KAT71_02765, partial [Gammaproteobacteria bacterium]|nr:hypothetical protein [Gammaproteobacteria bacterium]
NNKPIGKAGEEKQIAAELNFFQAHNPDSMGFVVEDDSMLPNYAIGDVVAGIIISLKDIKKISGLNCLVQLNDGSVVLRNLQVVATDNQLALLCLNPDTKQQKVIYGIDPASVAPVVWHRQKRPLP